MTSPLPSWRNGASRQTILDFVSTVTAVDAPNAMPARERLATFDNDGTLWCERPLYVQFMGALDFLADQATRNPALRMQQPYKAAYEEDFGWLSTFTANDWRTIFPW